MNFVEKLLENGFKETAQTSIGGTYNYKNNYFGVSTYHPDAVLENGGKEVFISLNGLIGYLFITQYELNRAKSYLDTRQVKVIVFVKDEKILYRSIYGEIPSDEFINDFIAL